MDGDSILVAMQGSIYLFGQFFADARHFGYFRFARPHQLLQTREVPEQLTATCGAHAGDPFQWRSGAGLASTLTVAGNRKAVSLIADMLDEVQGRGVPGKHQLMMRVGQIEGRSEERSV